MVDDHEDYQQGEAPAAHKLTHQNGGADEITVDGLAGELAAEQKSAWAKVSGKPVTFTPSAHKLSHQNGGVDKISVAGLLGETAELTTHKGLPTVHQDAPQLIENHRLIPGAHHGRYTDAEARALMSPISVPPPAFTPWYDTYDFHIEDASLRHRAALGQQYFSAPVLFPNSVTVTKLTLYGIRLAAATTFVLALYRSNRQLGEVLMASVVADWITGYNTGYEDSIAVPVIDNENFSYSLRLIIDPSISVDDVVFTGAKIDFTG